MPRGSTRYRLRRSRESDVPTLVAIANEVNPGFRATEAEWRHENTVLTSIPGYRLREWVAVDQRSGDVVGYGRMGQDVDTFHPREYWVGVEVTARHRGRGVGERLWRRQLVEARRLSATTLRAGCLASSRIGREFAEHRGFREVRRGWRSELDVRRPVLSSLPRLARRLRREGVLITTLAAEGSDNPRVLRALYRLDAETNADVPREGAYHPVSYPTFLAWTVRSPQALPDAVFIARTRNRFVGWSELRRYGTSRQGLNQGMTAVARPYRRRGIARVLKLFTIHYARLHGYRWIRTYNDSTNAPMWALNAELGFRRRYVRIQYARRLSPRAAGAPPPPNRIK